MASKVEPGHQALSSNGRKIAGGSGSSIGIFVVFLAFVILLVIAGGIGMININQRIRDTEGKIQRIDREIGKLDRELINLQSQYAACTTREFIFSQVAKFNLRLRPTPPSGRRTLLVYSAEQLEQLAAAGGRPVRGLALKSNNRK